MNEWASEYLAVCRMSDTEGPARTRTLRGAMRTLAGSLKPILDNAVIKDAAERVVLLGAECGRHTHRLPGRPA